MTPFGNQVVDHSSELPKLLARLPYRKAEYLSPMKASLVDRMPASPGWTYEIKFDGYRFIGVKERQKISLFSRNGHDWASKFPVVVSALKKLPCRSAVFDGEIVVLDEKGRSSFQKMQAAFTQSIYYFYYYLFDLLNLENHDLTALPLKQRRLLLFSVLDDIQDPLRISHSLTGPAKIILKEIKRLGLEGLIAKREDSLYEHGRRSRNWIKIKVNREQEFVIGGYTQPKGSRAYFGSLILGVYRQGKLHYISKAGTGFDSAVLADIHEKLSRRIVPRCPFVNLPTVSSRRGGLTRADMRRCIWVKPELVCQVRFVEWTQDEGLRHPVFLGLRMDKKAKEVVKESKRF